MARDNVAFRSDWSYRFAISISWLWLCKKSLIFFYFSSSLLCDAESTTTDNIVFRKPASPSLALRKAFSNPSLSIVFTTPSVPLVGDRNPFQRELHLFPKAPSSSEGGGCNRSYSELSFRKPTRPSLPLRKAPPLISVFSPQGRRGNRSSSELKPLRYKDGGPSEVCARFLCGMGPPC